MKPSIDFTTELAALMKFAGSTATAIRMYSAYSAGGPAAYLHVPPDPERESIDLMFLADALHHFERIGNDIEIGNPEQIVATCNAILTIYKDYEIEHPQRGERQSKPTFTLWANFVNLDQAKAAFIGILDKASARVPA